MLKSIQKNSGLASAMTSHMDDGKPQASLGEFLKEGLNFFHFFFFDFSRFFCIFLAHFLVAFCIKNRVGI